MLPASARVRSRTEHRLVAARGRRSRRGPLVVHLMPPPAPSTDPAPAPGRFEARAGVVVGKRVGNAVRRNLVKRRLREHLRNRLPSLPEGSLVVIRALPGAAEVDHASLGRALDGALRSVTERPSDEPRSSRPTRSRGVDA